MVYSGFICVLFGIKYGVLGYKSGVYEFFLDFFAENRVLACIHNLWVKNTVSVGCGGHYWCSESVSPTLKVVKGSPVFSVKAHYFATQTKLKHKTFRICPVNAFQRNVSLFCQFVDLDDNLVVTTKNQVRGETENLSHHIGGHFTCDGRHYCGFGRYYNWKWLYSVREK